MNCDPISQTPELYQQTQTIVIVSKSLQNANSQEIHNPSLTELQPQKISMLLFPSPLPKRKRIKNPDKISEFFF